MLEIKELFSGYEDIDIIKEINISINKGENLFIIGPNGCGKSTLLKSMANIIEYRGSVKIDEEEVSSLDRITLARKIGLMSQTSQIHFPYSVYDTVALGRYAYSKGALSGISKKDKKIILESIENVGLSDLKDKMITELSGGQLQRVFLARVFAQDPDVILLDEPTNHLDLKHQIEILQYLKKWVKDNNKILIGVLHDLNLVHYFADRVMLLDKGEVVSYGKASEVLNNERIESIYGIDIKGFMQNVLEKWR
ncbi:ABC transporter ATP-binding protein [Romboutsia weinsteinii]|uniref:ABC transporter ATP-binding protein n=1 Tax=Romboutsia weinsteinii TaxID=2020949 RepID=A0A371J3H9_9FIRM|nr:ABC transporter ATP-binding protein [Romboutsia weinsteinii]RDY27339.1 ABC transporter ATP-binding protein [Romboutsia weinsteinii]